MRSLVLAVGLAVFAAVSLAVIFHFKSDTRPAKFTLLGAASAANIFVFARELWLRPKDPFLLAIALGLFVVSAVLFAWAIQASRTAHLKLIFDPDNPRFVKGGIPTFYGLRTADQLTYVEYVSEVTSHPDYAAALAALKAAA